MYRQVLVPIVDGCEELEAVSIINSLRRAGAEVIIASCQQDGGLQVKASRDVVLVADTHISQCQNKAFHMIVLPGGMPGAENLRDCAVLKQLLLDQQQAGRWYAAICAAPAIVLSSFGLLDNVHATCYPSFMDQMEGALPKAGDTIVVDEKKRVITAQGPGSALGFSYKIIDALYGKDAYRPIAKEMIAHWAL